MYDDLKTFGHISRKDVAQILLSDRVVAGGRSLRTRALEDPTYVTRYICDATPGALSERDFVSFSEGARTITHRMIDRMGGEDARKVISDHYCKDAVKPMCAALEAFGRNGTLYVNGKAQEEPYVRYISDWNLPPRKVEPGHYYVVGDNRSQPIEQHRFGQVLASKIAGSPLF